MIFTFGDKNDIQVGDCDDECPCSGEMCASIVMRSLIESGDFAACPWEDLAPLIAWMAERMRE